MENQNLQKLLETPFKQQASKHPAIPNCLAIKKQPQTKWEIKYVTDWNLRLKRLDEKL